MSDVYVYSTLTCDQAYTQWNRDVNGNPVRVRAVLIKGGSNVADKNFHTPYGVVTRVSQEDYDLLKNEPSFIRHCDAGYIRVEQKKEDTELVVSDMVGRDESAPLVPQDYSEVNQVDEVKIPKVNGKRK